MMFYGSSAHKKSEDREFFRQNCIACNETVVSNIVKDLEFTRYELLVKLKKLNRNVPAVDVLVN